MAKRGQKKLQQKSWDSINPKYAELAHPEWETDKAPNRFWNDPENHRRYIKWLGKKLNIKTLDDWYRVTGADIIENCGGGILRTGYEGSAVGLITALVSRRQWHIWKFTAVPKGFWDLKQNRIDYLKWLGKELGYKSQEDWYQVCDSRINQNFGRGATKRKSLIELLSEPYPRYQWLPWKFKRVSSRFWAKRENRLDYMKWLGKKLNYKKLPEWYQVTGSDFIENHGLGLLERYQESPFHILKNIFPKHDWKAWLFIKVQKGFWKQKKNRIAYFRWLGKQLGYKKPKDWYQIERDDLRGHEGFSLLTFYRWRPDQGVMELYPNVTWYPWLFSGLTVPNGYWKIKKHRCFYYQWLAKKLKFRSADDWSRLTTADLQRNRGVTLLDDQTIDQIRKEATADCGARK